MHRADAVILYRSWNGENAPKHYSYSRHGGSGMFPGYAGKIVRVDLTRKQVKTQETSEESARRFVGGRGLAAKIFYDEVPVETEPFSRGNLLIFMTGPFAGTAALNSGRHCVTCKSPLTRAICAFRYWWKMGSRTEVLRPRRNSPVG